jgi:hypothetical protein
MCSCFRARNNAVSFPTDTTITVKDIVGEGGRFDSTNIGARVRIDLRVFCFFSKRSGLRSLLQYSFTVWNAKWETTFYHWLRDIRRTSEYLSNRLWAFETLGNDEYRFIRNDHNSNLTCPSYITTSNPTKHSSRERKCSFEKRQEFSKMIFLE